MFWILAALSKCDLCDVTSRFGVEDHFIGGVEV